MDNEFLRQEGKLAVNKLDLERLKIRFGLLKKSILDCLDPTEHDPANIRSDAVADAAVELDALRTTYMSLLAETQDIEKYLGRRR